MFGVWALVFIERRSGYAGFVASALLVASLMSSGIGLFFVVAAAGRTAFDRAFGLVYWLSSPLRSRTSCGTCSWTRCARDDRRARRARSRLCELRAARHRFRGRGDGRARQAPDQRRHRARCVRASLCGRRVDERCGASRRGLRAGAFSAVASMYAVIGVAERISTSTTHARPVRLRRRVPSHPLRRRLGQGQPHAEPAASKGSSRAGAALVGLTFAWAIAVNLNSLLTVRTQFQYQADLTRAMIELAIEHEGEPWLDPNAGST